MSYFIKLSLIRRNRNYRLLYCGQFISFLGTMITGVALPYQIYHETHATLMVGLLSLLQLLPLLFTALLGGVLADRHQRRRLLLIAESLLAVGCLLLTINATLAVPRLWVIFTIAPLMAAITGLHRPALDSITQQIVATKDLPLVSTLSTFMYSVCMIIGPALGGMLIAHFGIVVTFACDFMSFLLALVTLLMISELPKPSSNQQQSTWAALISGFQYAISRQELLGTYIVDFVAMIFGMPMALFPAIAHAHGGPKLLGMLYAAPAVGALVVSFFSSWTTTIRRHGLAICMAAVGWGMAIILFGLSANRWLALGFLSLAGAFDAISGIFRTTMWNELVPTQFRGRLSGIAMISYLSGPKLGDTEASLVAAAFGVTASIISGGVFCVLGVIMCYYALPRFIHYRSTNITNELVDTENVSH